MKRRIMLGAALAAAALSAAAPAGADSPGGGGTKVAVPRTGEEVYRAVCQACHMADGRGATGAGTIPSLAGNPRLAAAAYPIVVVAKGKGGMPWLAGTLSNAQIAEVVGYVRTHFGNAYPAPVTEDEVARLAGDAPGH
ncbi:MAG: c-type cytochrome [Phenylobacterium sp.]|uniref:c-type cytochrome n=1 Tax=Phenylobacterium sp. TaxID=1871053 RepID=UPI00391DD182